VQILMDALNAGDKPKRGRKPSASNEDDPGTEE
jgi:hypothetical protein